MVGLGAFSWEGRCYGFGGACRGTGVLISSIIRDSPTTTTTIFEFISRRPIFNFGYPWMSHQMPFFTVEHRENATIFHLCHQMLF